MTSKTLAAAGAQIAVLAVLGGSIAGCSDTEDPASPAAGGTATAPSDGDPGGGDPEDRDAGGPGGTAPDPLPFTEELNGRRLTVESFGTSAPADPGLWEVEAGHDVVYVEVRVENVDSEPWESNMAQFFLFDQTGESYASTFYDLEVGETPGARTLEVGDSDEGYVPFEVPAGTTGLRLEYAVDLSVDAKITLQLN